MALLGSYSAQSQLGDHDADIHGTSSDYLKPLDLSPPQHSNDELLDRIAELHRTHRGQTPSEVELCYLDNAKNLALYGVHMHEAKDADGDDVQLGVCAAGLLVYKQLLRVHRYTWPRILKIRYKRNLFHIDLRPDQGDTTGVIDSYKLSSATMAKCLWRLAVEHHAFFRLRASERESSAMFSRAPYRYTGRTLYETQQSSSFTDQHNRQLSRAAAAGTAPSRSMDNLTTGYSTERAEKHTLDDPRAITLDLRHRRGTGSLGDLDRALYDPNVEGQLSLLVGEARATYRPPVNGTVSYQTAGGQSHGQSDGQSGQPGRHSYMSYDDTTAGSVPGQLWNGARLGSVSSDASSVPDAVARPSRTKRTTSTDRPQSGGRHDDDYVTAADAETGEWTRHSSRTSTRTYTAPDGSIVTEYRTERNGVVETHIEKRTRIASLPEEDIDHDKELTDAIFAVTDMDPNMSVQKIEIHTRSEDV